MELNKELIEAQGLSEDQVTAINGVIESSTDEAGIAVLKKGWDGKANESAEGIIQGAIDKTQKETGFTLERKDTEKHSDYLARFANSYLESQKTELEKSKGEYDEKVKNFEGDSNLKAEIIGLNKQLDPLLKDKATYDELLNSGVKENVFRYPFFQE